jgi:hypothetical protein
VTCRVGPAGTRTRVPLRGGAGGPEVLECRTLTTRLAPGIDFAREVQLTLELKIGDVALVRRDGALCGFALFHSAPLAAGRPQDELRILKLVAENVEASRR